MFSNRRLLKILAGCLVLAGCFNEPRPQIESMRVNGADTGCLSDTPETLQAFFEGRASEERIRGLWKCADGALGLFVEHTRGAERGVYSPGELRDFLEVNFLRDIRVTDGLVKEAMQIKRIFMGGDVNVITAEELRRTRLFLATIRDQMLKVRPYMPLSVQHQVKQDPETLEKGLAAFVSAIDVIGSLLEKQGVGYSWDRFEKLLAELDPLYSGMEIKFLRARLPLLKVLKSTLIAPPAEDAQGDEWGRMLTTLTRLYAVGVRFVYTDKRYTSIAFGEGHEAFMKIAREVHAILSEAVLRYPGQVIPFAQLEKVVDSLNDEDLLIPGRIGEASLIFELKKDTIKAAFKPLVQRILGGSELGPQGRDSQGLSLGSVNRAFEFFDRWSEGQKYLERIYKYLGATVSVRDPAVFPSTAFAKSELLEVIEDGEVQDPAYEDVKQEILRQLRTKRPLLPEFNRRISFERLREADYRFTFHNLAQMNWMRELVRLLMRGYSEQDRARALAGATLPEFEQFMKDIMDPAIELRQLHQRLKDPAEKFFSANRFRDANLFLFSSNGDDKLDLDEGVELLAYMFSGNHVANEYHKKIASGPCKADILPGEVDFFLRPIIKVDCYRKALVDGFEEVWTKSPYLVQYLRTLNEGQRLEFIKLLEVAAGAAMTPMGKMDSVDANSMITLSDFIETDFLQFDRDSNGTIDQGAYDPGHTAENEDSSKEGQSAFTRFRYEILKLTKKGELGGNPQLDDFNMPLFMYLMDHGTLPGTPSLPLNNRVRQIQIGLAISSTWRSRAKWNIHADRNRVLQIISELVKSQKAELENQIREEKKSAAQRNAQRR